MHTLAEQPKATQQTTSTKSTIPGRTNVGRSHKVHSMLHLQRAIGNQAVLQMLRSYLEELDVRLTTAAGTIQTKLTIYREWERRRHWLKSNSLPSIVNG